MQTKILKNHYGLYAETLIKLNESLVLRVNTMRVYSRSIITSVNVHKIFDGGMSCELGRDYGKNVNYGNVGRLTAKVLAEFHNKSLKNADQFIAEAKKHHLIK